MSPLALTSFTATSAIGRGLDATLTSLHAQRSGLAPCSFETVRLDTCIGEVPGIDQVQLPAELAEFDCRNNRLAWLAMNEDGSALFDWSAIWAGMSAILEERVIKG